MKAILSRVPLLVLLVALGAAPAATEDRGACLAVDLSGFASDRGRAMIAVYNSKETYAQSKNSYRTAVAEITGRTARAVFVDLPPGSYVASVYHDENGNGRLDTGLFGIPVERYGFSRNARGAMGPPAFDDARITVTADDVNIAIVLK